MASYLDRLTGALLTSGDPFVVEQWANAPDRYQAAEGEGAPWQKTPEAPEKRAATRVKAE